MRSKYCKRDHPLQAKLFPYHSNIRKRLVSIRDEAEAHIRWIMGSGEKSFWHDTWCGGLPLYVQFPAHVSKKEKIKDYRTDDGWNLSKLLSKFPADMTHEIASISFNKFTSDFACWKLTPNGSFTTKSAWNCLRNKKPQIKLLGEVWNRVVSPSMSIFIW